MGKAQKITFGEMRASGVRDVLIYCRDHRCSHHVEINADGWGREQCVSKERERRQSIRPIGS